MLADSQQQAAVLGGDLWCYSIVLVSAILAQSTRFHGTMIQIVKGGKGGARTPTHWLDLGRVSSLDSWHRGEKRGGIGVSHRKRRSCRFRAKTAEGGVVARSPRRLLFRQADRCHRMAGQVLPHDPHGTKVRRMTARARSGRHHPFLSNGMLLSQDLLQLFHFGGLVGDPV